MSISGISGASSAYYQQSQPSSSIGAGPQTSVAQAASAPLGAAAPSAGASPAGAPHRHHHSGGDTTAQTASPLPSDASSSNILDTLV